MPGYTPKNYSLRLSRSGISVDAGVHRNEQMGFLIAGVSYTLSQFPSSLSSTPFIPATQARNDIIKKIPKNCKILILISS